MANILDLNLDEPVDIGGKKIPKLAIVAGGAGVIVLAVFVSRGGTLRKPAQAKVVAQDLGGSGVIYPGSGNAPGQFTLSETGGSAPAEQAPVAAAPISPLGLAPILTKRFGRLVYRLRPGAGQPTAEELQKLGLRYAPGISKKYPKLGPIFVTRADDPQRKPSKATMPMRPRVPLQRTTVPALDSKQPGAATKVG